MALLPKGMKQTKQRIKIMNILEEKEIPLTAEDILKEARCEFPAMALSTVYRNLDALLENQSIGRLMGSDGIAKYEVVKKENRHSHFMSCVACGTVLPLDSCPIRALETDIEQDTGFVVTGHRLELYGYCKKCRENMTNMGESMK